LLTAAQPARPVLSRQSQLGELELAAKPSRGMFPRGRHGTLMETALKATVKDTRNRLKVNPENWKTLIYGQC
jgi:hypothetical protein